MMMAMMVVLVVMMVPFYFSAGKADLPTLEAPGIGKLGGAICFDMDFPSYLRQAGAAGVNVLLQPSNTWGPIGAYHFRENALRAVENGFTHVRCSSGGYSGAATPFYSFVHHIATLDYSTVAFAVPLREPLWTPYSRLAGFLVEPAVAAAALAFSLLASLPEDFVRRRLPKASLRWLGLRQQDADFGATGESSGAAAVDADLELQRDSLLTAPQ